MSKAHKRPYRHPKYKTSYHVKNWPEYEKSMRDRRDIAVWLSQDAIDTWMPLKTGRLGGQQIYSDIAFETALTLRLVFHLPLGQMEGFLRSILKMMALDLPCPDHTTASRRNRTVGIRNHITLRESRLSYRHERTPSCPGWRPRLRLGEMFISRRSRARGGSGGSVSPDTTVGVTPSTRFFGTRRPSVDG